MIKLYSIWKRGLNWLKRIDLRKKKRRWNKIITRMWEQMWWCCGLWVMWEPDLLEVIFACFLSWNWEGWLVVRVSWSLPSWMGMWVQHFRVGRPIWRFICIWLSFLDLSQPVSFFFWLLVRSFSCPAKPRLCVFVWLISITRYSFFLHVVAVIRLFGSTIYLAIRLFAGWRRALTTVLLDNRFLTLLLFMKRTPVVVPKSLYHSSRSFVCWFDHFWLLSLFDVDLCWFLVSRTNLMIFTIESTTVSFIHSFFVFLFLLSSWRDSIYIVFLACFVLIVNWISCHLFFSFHQKKGFFFLG